MLPPKIHYFWFGSGEKPPLVKKCIESWKRFCPDCEIIEWNESNYDVTKNRYMHQAYQAKRWGFVSDYARLDVVYTHGGIYLDTDVEIIRSFDELFAGNGFLGFERMPNGNAVEVLVNTGQGFGAKKQDPVIRKMMEMYDELSFIAEDGSLNLTTCPYYNTEVLRSLGLFSQNVKQMIGEITVYPTEYFCPLDWKTRKLNLTDKTFSIHHFNASWLSDKEKKKRKWERRKDTIIHFPNKVLMMLIGEKRYASLKKKMKG